MIIKTDSRTPSPASLRKACEILEAGGIIVYPTDTVYGLGCSVENKDAIEKIYLIKQQRTDKPFSFVCSDMSHVSEYAHLNNSAFRIMKHLVPGPYTFVLPAARMKQLPKILVSRKKTVGIRVPDAPFAREIVRKMGHAILSTSATDASGDTLGDPEQIIERYNHAVDVIFDSGPLPLLRSTVLDLTGEGISVIREGAGEDWRSMI